MQEMWVRSLGQEDPLEKEMATRSSTLGGKSHGQRSLVGYTVHGVSKNQTRLSYFTFTFPVFLPGESCGQRSLAMESHRVRHNSVTEEQHNRSLAVKC